MAIGIGAVAVVGIAGSAFANTLGTVPATNAGQGVTVTSGYTVTNVRFTTNAATTNNSAANINGVKFSISPSDATHTILARLNGSGNWAACTVDGSYPAVTCAVVAGAVSTVTSVEIVAYKSS